MQQKKVKINMERRVEEGGVDAMSRREEAARFQSNMEKLLLKKEEELIATRMAAEQGITANDGVTVETSTKSRSIYPVLDLPTSPV